MTNDYKRGHSYRMKTDSNYRKRHNGRHRLAKKPRSTRAHRGKEYHHTKKGGRWVPKRTHGRIHKVRRGKTPYSRRKNGGRRR